ncbi:hypothetical protein GF323_02060 [Candidatus Woesearchaeota archaeon]|nr:hypothetical protein [Candidatus Woesearchaeota archaeon]
MIKWKKFFIAGIVAAIIRYLVSSGFGMYFADLYDPTTGLWRAMTPSWMQNVIIAHVIIAFLAVFAYAVINRALGKVSEKGKKGAKFGFLVWLVRDIPCSVLTYVFMPVTFTLVATWLVSGLIISLINGLVIARIYK